MSSNIYLDCIKEYSKPTDEIYWHNTIPVDKKALMEVIKNNQYRVFIREGNDINGYPLYCIYWGKEKNPIKNFNVSKTDKKLMYELKK